MDFRRAHRDERRRRVLIEEPEGPDSGSASPRAVGSANEPARRYADAALAPSQPRVVDLIPSRTWSTLVLLLLLVSVGTGIEALYGYLALGYTPLNVSDLAAIDLAHRGSIATWYSSALLAACAVYGLLVYQIRRYRADDYRGRYRMWCWVVPLFLLASIDQVAGLQASAQTVLLQLAGIADYPDAALVWHSSVALLAGAVVGRLLVEMRSSRLASLFLVAVLGCLGAAYAANVGWLLPEPNVFRAMVLSGLIMGASLAMFAATVLYGRHVYLDARDGRTQRRRKKRSSRRQSTAATEPPQDGPAERRAEPRRPKASRRGGRTLRTDPPHPHPGQDAGRTESKSADQTARGKSRRKAKPQQRVAAEATQVSAQDGSTPCQPDDDQLEQPRRLSKAERKRLRKQRRRDRQT